jgi:hypothetical protein
MADGGHLGLHPRSPLMPEMRSPPPCYMENLPSTTKKPPCRLLTAKICNLLKLGEVLLISNMKTRIFAAAILNLETILNFFSIMFMKLRNSTGMQNLVFLALTVLVEI